MGARSRSSSPHSNSGISAASTASSLGPEDVARQATASDGRVSATGISANSSGAHLLEVVGRGSGGIEEMATRLCNNELMWALLRIELGSGAFARTKIVLLHFNAYECAPLERSRANSFTKDIKAQLRHGNESSGYHACMQFNHVADVTVDNVLRRARNIFVVDHIGDYSTDWALNTYREQILRERRGGDLPAPTPKKGNDTGRRGRVATAEQVFTPHAHRKAVLVHRCAKAHPAWRDARPTLRAVADNGLWNWALLGADPVELPLLGRGSGSVEELRRAALDMAGDTVTFGLLRMRFGAGRFMRTKFVLLHLIGPRAGAVTRGRYSTLTPAMAAAIKKHASISVSLPDMSVHELTSEDLINRLRAVFAVDDDLRQPDGVCRSLFSVEAFGLALALERAAIADQPRREAPCRMQSCGGEPPPMHPAGADARSAGGEVSRNVGQNDFAETVRLVTSERECNWALFRPRLLPRGQGGMRAATFCAR